jgi:hypothetical protein
LERNDWRVDRAGLGQYGWVSHRRISRLSRILVEEKAAAVTVNPIAHTLALVVTLGRTAPLAIEAQQVRVYLPIEQPTKFEFVINLNTAKRGGSAAWGRRARRPHGAAAMRRCYPALWAGSAATRFEGLSRVAAPA